MIRIAAVALVFAGLVLGVRVMFFGVRRLTEGNRLSARVWPLALATFLFVDGVALYALRGSFATGVTATAVTVVTVVGGGAAGLVWWAVRRSAAKPSTDPEDDPRYRFQGHIARVIEPIAIGRDGRLTGRIALEFEGQRHEFQARWSSPGPDGEGSAAVRREADAAAGAEVVVEIVEDGVAYVEPWSVVEQRL